MSRNKMKNLKIINRPIVKRLKTVLMVAARDKVRILSLKSVPWREWLSLQHQKWQIEKVSSASQLWMIRVATLAATVAIAKALKTAIISHPKVVLNWVINQKRNLNSLRLWEIPYPLVKKRQNKAHLNKVVQSLDLILIWVMKITHSKLTGTNPRLASSANEVALDFKKTVIKIKTMLSLLNLLKNWWWADSWEPGEERRNLFLAAAKEVWDWEWIVVMEGLTNHLNKRRAVLLITSVLCFS